ncbi:hypothetical protein [Treponema sp.]|uniref:hypothetical protein n=1 Tax=Treponema sp. TaxID=166 RepID=UPI00298EB05B|nr:hypothetical protein [Treponema sp.]MCQ2241648.1 hypothetical protein [Treponema sp.]
MNPNAAPENESLFSVKEFIHLLWSNFNLAEKTGIQGQDCDLEMFSYGRKKGWLEDEDERYCENPVNRRTGARIIHQFMKTELKIPDIQDIQQAEVLKDLYTCHSCANHVAQVYLREFFKPEEFEWDGKACLIFNHLEEMEKKEAENIILQIKGIVLN